MHEQILAASLLIVDKSELKIALPDFVLVVVGFALVVVDFVVVATDDEVARFLF